MEHFTLNPIGYVENNISNRKDIKSPGIKSSIYIYEEYIEGLKHLDENSHIIILCYFDKSNRSTLKVFPQKYGIKSTIEKGVFATRSPDRPNPIAISVSRLLEISHNKIIVDPLDVINSTPVIDIKPYSVDSDAIFNIEGPNKHREYHTLPEDKLYDFLSRGLNNYIFSKDHTFNLGINSIIKLIQTIKLFPDRNIIKSVETNYTGNALDCLYYHMKFTPGEEKFIINNNLNKNKNYLKINLKSDETWVLTYNNSETHNINILEIKKL